MTKQELHELMRQLDEKYFLPDEWRCSRVIFSEADGEETQWREYLRQNEHSLFYDNPCLLIRRNGSIATQGRPDGVPAKDFLLQNYEELVKKRVYLIGSKLSLYLFCADRHDFLPVAKARLKDTRSNTDGDAMRALFLKSPMAEPYVRQAMEYYQRLIHVQNGQPNGNTAEDAMVRVLESLADVSEEDRKILSQNKNFVRHLEAFAETAAGRDAKGQAYDNALRVACILLSVPAFLVDDKDASVLLRLLCGFGFYLTGCCQAGRMLYQYRQTGYVSPSRAQKSSLFCLPVIVAVLWLLWIRIVPYNQIAIYLVGGVLAGVTYLQYFADKSD
ncbi:hypothetical protein [Kingella denitrificans]